jgi:hypothetical protein
LTHMRHSGAVSLSQLKSIGALRSEQFGLAFVEFDLAYRKFGAALVEQVFDQINRTRWANTS